jgi:hypothetical protein
MSESDRKYSAVETARLREEMMKTELEPMVAEVFKKHPELRSAVMLVSQYWNDEAEDAVHYDFFFSKLPEPDMEAAAKSYGDEDPVNLPEGWSHWDLMNSAELGIDWDDNGEAIPLFAAFTKEDCHQEMTSVEAGSPYAFFMRTPKGVQTRVVARMLRPWLDGVRPSFEREEQ